MLRSGKPNITGFRPLEAMLSLYPGFQDDCQRLDFHLLKIKAPCWLAPYKRQVWYGLKWTKWVVWVKIP